MKNFIVSGFSDEISPNLTEQLEYLKELGIGYFEIRGVDGANISELTLEQARAVKEQADKYGIKVSSVGSPIGKIEITDDFDAHVRLLAHIIAIAKILQTQYVRVFSFYIRDGRDPSFYRDEVLRRMAAMTDLAREQDIILLHENEKDIYGDTAPRCKDILETVHSPNLRAVFDPANFVQCDQSVVPEALEMLRPYIAYLHIKDSTADKEIVPAGYGIGDVETVLQQLKRSGFKGFASLEPHLGSFVGFDKLEGTPLHAKGKDQSGPHTFKIAYDALNHILERVDI